MKISKIILASSLVLFGLTGCSFGGSTIMKINGEPVTKAQYEEAYKVETNNPQFKMFENAMKDKEGTMPLIMKSRIVNELIVKELLRQEVTKRNIAVTEEEIKAKKAEITEKAGGEDKLKEILERNDVSEAQFADDVTNEIKIDKLVDSLGDMTVSEKEVKAFYNENKERFNYPERVRASHILIKSNPAQIKQDIISADKKGEMTSEEINKKTKEEVDAKMKLAKEIRAKALKDPKQFAALAKQYSEDTVSAQQGGDLGFFPKEAMVEEFSVAAFSLKPGAISEVVVTDFGNHIIIVTDKAKAGIQPFDAVKDEIRVYLEQKKKVDALTSLMDGLKASAKIEYVNSEFDLNKIQDEIKVRSEKQQQKMMEERAKNAETSTTNSPAEAPLEKTEKK